MEFLWTEAERPRRYSALAGDLRTEVLVIGGGMAGVLCARRLQEAGMDCVLVEAGRIGGGITRGTTAVITAQHDTLYQDIARKRGEEIARGYLRANLEAADALRQMAGAMDCDYEELPTIMFFRDDREKMEREARLVEAMGFPARFRRETPLPFPVAGAVEYPGMGQFHPLKFLYGAAEPLRIYENTFVTELRGATAVTRHGTIRANKVIVATHFPFVNRRGLYFMKLYQKRSYVVAFEHGPQLGCAIEDGGKHGFYLRNYKDLLLIGGGDHRTGNRGGGYGAVEQFAGTYFPEARPVYRWSNQDCMTLDGIPYIGPYSPGNEDIFVATGFGHWGMTSSMAAADLLKDLVRGRRNPYAAVFDPGRSMLRPQLFANLGQTLVNFLCPTAKRCTHLGCALRWNPLEHSWDCPCHGSRFGADGSLVDNPAMREAKTVKGK